jgi:spoIIIJ-associated protein
MKKEDIANLIKDLIEKTGVSMVNMNINDDKGNLWFSVEVNEPHFFISHEGEALQALNHVIRRMVENKLPVNNLNPESQLSLLIDINDFQKKKIDAIRAVAHMMSERARYFKSNIEIDPMSSFERRIVHEFLSNATDIETESIGFGPNRRVVIKYKGSI